MDSKTSKRNPKAPNREFGHRIRRERVRENGVTVLPREGLSFPTSEIRVLENRILRIYGATLASLGLPPLQFILLHILRRRGSASIGELAEVVNLRTSAASRNLNVMTRNGWVLTKSKIKGAQRTVSITSKGEAVLQTAYPLWRQGQQQAVAALGEEGCQALDVISKHLLDSL